MDHKWCDCRNRRAVFDFGIYTGSLFFKDQVWFPIYISIEQQGGDSKGKHRADRRRKNVRRGKNLEMDVDHMSVYLKPSQNGKVCVGTEDIDERANLQIYKEGDTLNIETDLESNRINQAGTIILYLPQDVKFYEMDISVGAGSLKSKLQSVHAENADIAVAAGAAEIQGIMAQEMYLECGVGSATLVLHGEQEDYNYSLECGMGEVKIADGSYSGIAVEQQIDHGASKNLNIECGMGSVNVKFEK